VLFQKYIYKVHLDHVKTSLMQPPKGISNHSHKNFNFLDMKLTSKSNKCISPIVRGQLHNEGTPW
jgi:hypothetical protein